LDPGAQPAGEDPGQVVGVQAVSSRQMVLAAGAVRMNPSRARAMSSRSWSQSAIAANDDAPAMTAHTATVNRPARG
jgi:hypothetical protein